ncbi:MAG: vanadium-dependent haloperoxidase [Halieaceae bacterium]|jgi:hypothetical protein|nr:vanadium-dependent haloperoxidase [Halieaceae bacterium]
MKIRKTGQPFVLEDREDLERFCYDASPGDLTLPECRDAAAHQFRNKVISARSHALAHNANGDEQTYADRDFLASFNKGLPRLGVNDVLPEHDEFLRFRRATHTANFFVGPDVPKLGTNLTAWRAADFGTDRLRGWEAPECGLSMEAHGPDPHTVTMAAAPQLESDQLAFEIAEVYWLALLRDVPFSEFSANPQGRTGGVVNDCPKAVSTVQDAVDDLNLMMYASTGFKDEAGEAAGIVSRTRLSDGGAITTANVFRGVTPGDAQGPYLSQFLLIGCPTPASGGDRSTDTIRRGEIGYGSQIISQRYRPHQECLDHMTDPGSFLDVQEGANIRGDRFEEKSRFITTPRDLATFVHYDALYQAYLNACLMLIGFGAPVDPGIAMHNSTRAPLAADLHNVTDGFALFGGPHILNLVTEVATRGLKAVRYQKFNVHCRLRPEAVGGVVHFDPHNVGDTVGGKLSGNLKQRIADWNKFQNSAPNFAMRTQLDQAKIAGSVDQETLLLPMAFPEGSPMHPAYGAGHATVAGACVTMLKAFFDADAVFAKDTDTSPDNVVIIPRSQYEAGGSRYRPVAYVSNAGQDGKKLSDVSTELGSAPLTVGGELNKLAANIAIGRNMAGVHFYTDYIDSLTMGEEVAIQVLRENFAAFEQYPETVRPSMTLSKFLGGYEQITAN